MSELLEDTTWVKPLSFYERRYNELKKDKSLSEKQIAEMLIKEDV